MREKGGNPRPGTPQRPYKAGYGRNGDSRLVCVLCGATGSPNDDPYDICGHGPYWLDDVVPGVGDA